MQRYLWLQNSHRQMSPRWINSGGYRPHEIHYNTQRQQIEQIAAWNTDISPHSLGCPQTRRAMAGASQCIQPFLISWKPHKVSMLWATSHHRHANRHGSRVQLWVWTLLFFIFIYLFFLKGPVYGTAPYSLVVLDRSLLSHCATVQRTICSSAIFVPWTKYSHSKTRYRNGPPQSTILLCWANDWYPREPRTTRPVTGLRHTFWFLTFNARNSVTPLY